MNAITVILLSASMSTDAFAANVAKGAVTRGVGVGEMGKTAAIFGVTEMLTLLLGWALGKVAAPYIAAFDHWVAFVLLTILGVKMLYEGGCPHAVDEADAPVKTSSKGIVFLFIAAVATGIDSMVMGVSLALMNAQILPLALAVGLMTAALSAIGLKLGQALGHAAGRRAVLFGGLVLIGIGLKILLEHLGVF